MFSASNMANKLAAHQVEFTLKQFNELQQEVTQITSSHQCSDLGLYLAIALFCPLERSRLDDKSGINVSRKLYSVVTYGAKSRLLYTKAIDDDVIAELIKADKGVAEYIEGATPRRMLEHINECGLYPGIDKLDVWKKWVGVLP